jgi:hypothetical protein
MGRDARRRSRILIAGIVLAAALSPMLVTSTASAAQPSCVVVNPFSTFCSISNKKIFKVSYNVVGVPGFFWAITVYNKHGFSKTVRGSGFSAPKNKLNGTVKEASFCSAANRPCTWILNIEGAEVATGVYLWGAGVIRGVT